MILFLNIFWQVFQTKSGIPITLSIVFAAVARRLGVELEPVCIRSNFGAGLCQF